MNYILKLPYEFGAFQLGIELTLIQYVSEHSFTITENEVDKVYIYNVEFDDEDKLYSFDKEIRESMPYIFENK